MCLLTNSLKSKRPLVKMSYLRCTLQKMSTQVPRATPQETQFIKDTYTRSKNLPVEESRRWFNEQLYNKYGKERAEQLLHIIHELKNNPQNQQRLAQQRQQQQQHAQLPSQSNSQHPPQMHQHTQHHQQQPPRSLIPPMQHAIPPQLQQQVTPIHAPRAVHAHQSPPKSGTHLPPQQFPPTSMHGQLPSLQNISSSFPAIPGGSLLTSNTAPSPNFDIASGDSFLQQHTKLTNSQMPLPAAGFLNASPEPTNIGRSMNIQQSARKSASPAPKSKPATTASVIDPAQSELEKVSVDEFADDKPGRGAQRILQDADLASEEATSASQMREALANRAPIGGVQMPGVAARVSVDSGAMTHRPDPPEVWNLLHQTRAEALARKVLKSGITISQDALKDLSTAVQSHLTDVIECSYNIAKKRINKTVNDQYQMSLTLLNSKTQHGDIGDAKPHMRSSLALKWGPDIYEYLQKKNRTARMQYSNKLADLHDNIKAELQRFDDERKPQRKRNADDSEVWWKKQVESSSCNFIDILQESDEKNGLMSLEELAMAHFKKKVAEVNELGPFAKKKSRKNEDKDEDKVDAKPIAERQTGTVDMTSSDKLLSLQPGWTAKHCPLAVREMYFTSDGRVEHDTRNTTTVILSDVVSGLSKLSAEYSNGMHGQMVGNALRLARTALPALPSRRVNR